MSVRRGGDLSAGTTGWGWPVAVLAGGLLVGSGGGLLGCTGLLVGGGSRAWGVGI